MYVVCSTLGGTGSIEAHGGESLNVERSPGGGGRIAVYVMQQGVCKPQALLWLTFTHTRYASTASTFAGVIHADGGTQLGGSSFAQRGGTVFLSIAGQTIPPTMAIPAGAQLRGLYVAKRRRLRHHLARCVTVCVCAQVLPDDSRHVHGCFHRRGRSGVSVHQHALWLPQRVTGRVVGRGCPSEQSHLHAQHRQPAVGARHLQWMEAPWMTSAPWLWVEHAGTWALAHPS